ncbi:2-dehydro-3-deoxygalactonokinase [Aquabacterium sp. OR-4]|uniref:2-dehydro-3-deoxygalactonokinase n=1 Tax=Aquabacterium sp. OR-4 TaxID=2978127 RepID=UPI0021B32469|nr:2-dehydro-3-deoxygalactonokinase [Aquabacterium sp. OR-4]MDT7835677.1 2-dehydro-3-deoxygalactonokinase [Aquabacterium sp. OR-4]
MSRHWIGIDWGTTHRRAWWFTDGLLQRQLADDQGLLAAAPHFAPSLAALRARLGAPLEATVVMAGMVGSASGWQAVPYLDAGRPLADWAQQLVPVAGQAQCFIVPGCCWREAGAEAAVDVMRGEETQLLGAWQLAPQDGWALLPGTHSKWVLLQGGAVQRLHTYLSGELHALLSAGGTLAPLLAAQAGSDPLDRPEAFAQGVRAAGRAALSRALFGLRAQVVTGALAPEAAGAYLSGLLLGAEWHEALARGLAAQQPVRLIGSPALCRLHARCAELLGRQSLTLDIEAVQTAAWRALGAGAAGEPGAGPAVAPGGTQATALPRP